MIFTDSQSSLEALNRVFPSHPLIQDVQTKLIDLIHKGKTVDVCKIPSHVGVPGIEAADRVAVESINIPGLHTTKIPIATSTCPYENTSDENVKEGGTTKTTT